MRIYATEYSYLDGTDTTAHPDKDAAMRRACKIILDWIDEVEDKEMQQQILYAVMDREFESAVRTWGRWQNDNMNESISVLELEVQSEPSAEELCSRAHNILFG